MTAKDLEETLAAIANKAKTLLDAGVVGRVSIGDISFKLSHPEPPQAATATSTPAVEHENPIDDPATFGGGRLPRRRGSAAQPKDREE